VTPGDVAVINWGTSSDPERAFRCGNDYRPGRLVGVSREERQQHLQRARQRTQAYLHYLHSQDGIDLKPRGDLTWTGDGLALEPYIREARRGIALTTIRHEDVAESFFPNRARARCFDDSVGIGQYHYLDLHGNASGLYPVDGAESERFGQRRTPYPQNSGTDGPQRYPPVLVQRH
jgi:hypothetical protein